MKAVVCTKYGPPEVLQLQDVEKPAPKNNEVLIKILATAVTASDCITRGIKVRMPLSLVMRVVVGFRGPRQPILGLVLAGEIESTGKAVQRFKQGDQVYGFTEFGFGTYAEYKCMSEEACLVTKPGNVSYEEAAAVVYGGILAGHFVKKGNIRRGQRVLVYGASGAIGTTAVQLAKHFGAEVTGVCSTTNLELVKSLGADAVIDYTQENALSGGQLYDFVLDAVGKRKSSPLKIQCQQALTPTGKYISVDDGSPKARTEYLTLLKELIEAGDFKPVIDRVYPLDQMVEAHRYVETGHKKGNVVITVTHSNEGRNS
jgi:NADPH:quinone reductase-like Zn-dependent oxidoreductase